MSQFDKEFEQAIKVGISNGDEPDRSTTRKESAIMNLRAAQYAIDSVQTIIDERFQQILDAINKD